MEDCLYWIWFQLVFGIGSRRAELFLNYFANPREIYDSLRQGGQAAAMLTPTEKAASEPSLEQAELILRRTLKKGCGIVTPDHPLYPPSLRHIYSKPAALYVKGDLACLADTLVIAMVGTRKYSSYGERAARSISRELAGCGVTVVSGLAKGIDTVCHSGALEAGGKTVGVLGCGIDVDYPRGSADIKRAMSKNGAVVTEFPLGTQPKPGNFPIRNRIVSGMARGLVVVEADLHSGSLITAAHALEQGRDVFAVPGDIFSGRSRGCHKLIGEGARLVNTAADILAEYADYVYKKTSQPTYNIGSKGFASNNTPTLTQEQMHESKITSKGKQPEILPPSPRERKPLPEGIGPGCDAVYGSIGFDPLTVEEIAQNLSLDIGLILSALTELEIYGLIQGYPGRRFSLS